MHTKDEHYIISVVTRSLVLYLEGKGINADELLEKHKLNRDDVLNASRPVSAKAVEGIWYEAREILKSPLIHLELCKNLRPGSYRALEYLIISSETLGVALENLARFVGTINSFLNFKTEVMGEEISISITSNDPAFPLDPFWAEITFMSLYSTTMSKVDGDIEVKKINMAHKEMGNIEDYELLFKTKVFFNQDKNSMILNRDAWDKKMQFADKKLVESLTNHLSGLMNEINTCESTLRKNIQQYFMQRMSETEPKIEDLAHHLGLSVRNLQRHLKEEGTTFSEILDSTKEKLAIKYLGDEQLSLSDISFLLGFSDQSTFQRAFRRWRGISPGAFRKENA